MDHDADSFHDDDQEGDNDSDVNGDVGDNDGDVNGDGGEDEGEEEEKKDIFNKNHLFQSNRKMN